MRLRTIQRLPKFAVPVVLCEFLARGKRPIGVAVSMRFNFTDSWRNRVGRRGELGLAMPGKRLAQKGLLGSSNRESVGYAPDLL